MSISMPLFMFGCARLGLRPSTAVLSLQLAKCIQMRSLLRPGDLAVRRSSFLCCSLFFRACVDWRCVCVVGGGWGAQECCRV